MGTAPPAPAPAKSPLYNENLTPPVTLFSASTGRRVLTPCKVALTLILVTHADIPPYLVGRQTFLIKLLKLRFLHTMKTYNADI